MAKARLLCDACHLEPEGDEVVGLVQREASAAGHDVDLSDARLAAAEAHAAIIVHLAARHAALVQVPLAPG